MSCRLLLSYSFSSPLCLCYYFSLPFLSLTDNFLYNTFLILFSSNSNSFLRFSSFGYKNIPHYSSQFSSPKSDVDTVSAIEIGLCSQFWVCCSLMWCSSITWRHTPMDRRTLHTIPHPKFDTLSYYWLSISLRVQTEGSFEVGTFLDGKRNRKLGANDEFFYAFRNATLRRYLKSTTSLLLHSFLLLVHDEEAEIHVRVESHSLQSWLTVSERERWRFISLALCKHLPESICKGDLKRRRRKGNDFEQCNIRMLFPSSSIHSLAFLAVSLPSFAKPFPISFCVWSSIELYLCLLVGQPWRRFCVFCSFSFLFSAHPYGGTL